MGLLHKLCVHNWALKVILNLLKSEIKNMCLHTFGHIVKHTFHVYCFKWTLQLWVLFPPLDFQNYLRTQTGSTTTINIIICTVDYLLRLQVQRLSHIELFLSVQFCFSEPISPISLLNVHPLSFKGIDQWLLLVLLRKGHHRRTRQEELLQGHDSREAGL